MTHSQNSPASVYAPEHRITASLEKAALKTHALRALRDCQAPSNLAKRLECVRFIGAFGPRVQFSGSWSRPIVLILSFVTASLAAAPLGQFEAHTDVGSPKLAGSATYDAVAQEYSVTAAGV